MLLGGVVLVRVDMTLQWDNNFKDVTLKLQQNLMTTKNLEK